MGLLKSFSLQRFFFTFTRARRNPDEFKGGHNGTVSNLVVTSDPSVLISCSSAEKDVLVWDVRSQTVAKKISFSDNVVSLNMSNDQTHFVVTTAGKTVEFFGADKFEPTQKHKLDRVCSCAAYHVKKGIFVTGSDSEEWARGYDFQTGKELFVNKGHHGVINCIAFNPEKDFFATGADDATIRFWELKDVGASSSAASSSSV